MAFRQAIKDNYANFEVPYYGTDNDDYVNGEGFCCDNKMLKAGAIGNGNDNPEVFQYYYHSDHLGSSSLITNLDGEVVQHVEYVPFGEVFLEERNNTWNTPYLFNAKELDEETGNYYFGKRYYDPRTSVWLSTDPLQEKYPNVSSYAYAFLNPVKFIDPTGMEGGEPDGTYTIQKGDNFAKLEGQWGMPQGTLSELNPGVNPNKLQIGQSIITEADIPVNSPYKIEKEYTSYNTIVTKQSSSTIKYAITAGAVLIADDATAIGVADDPLLIGVGIWALGAGIYDLLNTKTITTYEPFTYTMPDNAPFYYATYTRTNPTTNQVYVGRTSGYGDPQSIVRMRDANHHMTGKGYGKAVLSTFLPATLVGGYGSRGADPSYWAIRGSEQLQIEHYRRQGISGNGINGISPTNDLLGKYLQAARNLLGH